MPTPSPIQEIADVVTEKVAARIDDISRSQIASHGRPLTHQISYLVRIAGELHGNQSMKVLVELRSRRGMLNFHDVVNITKTQAHLYTMNATVDSHEMSAKSAETFAAMLQIATETGAQLDHYFRLAHIHARSPLGELDPTV